MCEIMRKFVLLYGSGITKYTGTAAYSGITADAHAESSAGADDAYA